VDDLSELLVLLHDAEEPFVSLRARYRVWRHRERAHAAFLAQAKRRGSTTFGVHGGGGAPLDPESVELVDIWRVCPDRARVAYSGGDRDGSVGVSVGERWWHFDQRVGATSNVEDPSIGSGTGAEFAAFLEPPRLLGALRFAPLGRGTRAGREVIVADAWPRLEPPRGRPPSFGLHELGAGGDRYRLEVDAERGLVLAAHAFADGEPFQVVEAVEFEVDRDIDADMFVFRPPEGEEIRRPGHRGEVRHHASIPEAQAAMPFTLLVPEHMPSTWTFDCTYSGPSDRPPSSPTVGINYRSDSGHESLNLILRPAGADPHRTDASDWREARAGEYTVRVHGRGERGPQSQLRLEHAGTSVLMLSDTLSGDQLIALAAMLVPAPAASHL